MKNLSTFLVLWLLAFAVSCSSVYDVSYDYDKQANFDLLKTYDWLPIPEGIEVDSLVTNRIKNAVNTQLADRGFRMTSDNPNFLIAMHVGTKEKVTYRTWGYGYGGHWGGRRTSRFSYEEGTLMFDFVDAMSKELIWRGVAKGFVGSAKTPEKTDKLVKEFVHEILKNFPPSPSK